jgi:hypothetical protein
MAYMRGDLYVWRDNEERLHIWSRNAADDVSEIEGLADAKNAGGVSLSAAESDALALMLVAELVRSGALGVAVERTLRAYGGNFGGSALEELGSKLVAACTPLAVRA